MFARSIIACGLALGASQNLQPAACCGESRFAVAIYPAQDTEPTELVLNQGAAQALLVSLSELQKRGLSLRDYEKVVYSIRGEAVQVSFVGGRASLDSYEILIRKRDLAIMSVSTGL